MDMAVIELSRLQFALTAMYHFLFVPLTLGLSFMLVIMESIYVITKRPIWRIITRFWGKLFGINFVLGVATGLTMEFEFGTNWAYYAHYVGDIFGAPLAIEGLMAFFLEATMVGVMFFGWDRLSRRQHLAVTFLVAVPCALTGYVSQQNFDAQWISTQAKDGLNSVGVGAFFNVTNFGQMYSYHVLLLPVAVVALVSAHVLLVRRHGVVPPFELDRRRAAPAASGGRDGEADGSPDPSAGAQA